MKKYILAISVIALSVGFAFFTNAKSGIGGNANLSHDREQVGQIEDSVTPSPSLSSGSTPSVTVIKHKETEAVDKSNDTEQNDDVTPTQTPTPSSTPTPSLTPTPTPTPSPSPTPTPSIHIRINDDGGNEIDD